MNSRCKPKQLDYKPPAYVPITECQPEVDWVQPDSTVPASDVVTRVRANLKVCRPSDDIGLQPDYNDTTGSLQNSIRWLHASYVQICTNVNCLLMVGADCPKLTAAALSISEFNLTTTAQNDFFLTGSEGLSSFYRTPIGHPDQHADQMYMLSYQVYSRVDPPYNACCVALAELGAYYWPQMTRIRQALNQLTMTCFGESAASTCQPTKLDGMPNKLTDCRTDTQYVLRQLREPTPDSYEE
ncbi:uncharacterized protein L969DRAFT_50832 [Mixia osmundae IAM 14324]|uniref:Uncharacterized protein n=1 Tax=Mixia osmundae (strain CBS 9802 / IAM 14324 / JCM 22182 / KY 12970) TaxID=764103 RepID=G7E0J4_MIXOS|nr:uncharacterized protein L969DRAFT_50832 [Mixia osmundae IAM 14324]KEI38366.1 hypothetical protein L969DRAFT_50832 [Mixia osmundae IAM 14324]GAA96354.1 hypothetical protein E5Q_03020 [Mixia osmundae IAM 14324]